MKNSKQFDTVTSLEHPRIIDTLKHLMKIYSIPKSRIVDLILHTPTTAKNIVDFILHMEQTCNNFNSKKARNKLLCYREFKLKGMSHYKCCVLLVDWEGELG